LNIIETDVIHYAYDFSVKLYKTLTIFEYNLSDNYWVLFTPDWPGFPIVVDGYVHTTLSYFEGGATVSDVLTRLYNEGDSHYKLDQVLSSIGMLEEKGFLRNYHSVLPYTVPEIENSKFEFFEVWLHINDDCNLSCSYCFVKKKSHTAMSPEVLSKTAHAIAYTAKLNKIKRINIKFAGGEPTLVMPLVEDFRRMLLEEIDGMDIKLHTALISNGTVINKRLISFLKQPDTSISISLDGYGDDHNIFRKFKNSRKGSWDIIQRNLSYMREHSIKPLVLATITEETSKGLPKLIKWVMENDYNVRISIVRNPLNSSSCENIIDAFEKTFTELEDPFIFIDPRDTLRICELQFDYPANGVPCSIGKNHIVIRSDGNIVSCPMVVDEPGITPSEDLLSSCRASFDYSPSQRRSSSSEDDCLNCKWFTVCAGGCPVMNQKILGYPFIKSPLCDFYTYVIPRYAIFFGRKLLQCFRQESSLDKPIECIIEG
jgi:uncharacterized protein